MKTLRPSLALLVSLWSAFALTTSAAPGVIATTLGPPGPIMVGDTFTVTLRISGYTNPDEIDGYNFRVTYNPALFSLVAGSLEMHDAAGADENWLRLAPQDGVGAGALPLSDFTATAAGVADVSVTDLRLSSTRGTTAGAGFLYEFKLQALALGTGTIASSAGAGGTVLFDTGLNPVGVPIFSNATMIVTSCTNPPVIRCPTNITVWTCSNSLPVTYSASATNLCGTNVTIVCTPPSGSSFPAGVTTTVTCTATDSLTNRSTCTFTVRVIRDTLPPTIACPGNIVLWTCTNGSVVNFAVAATDDCDTNVTVTCVPLGSGSFFPVGTTTVTCTARDDCNSTSTCVFTVRVIQDTQPPVITCPSNVVLWTCSNSIVVPYSVTATDDCDPSVTIACVPSGNVFSVGTTTVTCTARDDCGKTNACSFTVRVIQDTLPPVITCPSNIVVWTCSNSIVVPYTVTATDDCDTNVTITCVPPGNVFSVGTTTVTCTARDDCGKTNACTFTVRVIQDSQPPVIVCPSNIVVWSCSNSLVVPYTVTATDDCDTNVTITCVPAGTTFLVGITTVTCTARDDCGKTNACTFTVRVIQDSQPPVIVCPSNIVVSACTNIALVPYTVTATDDCDTNVTVTCVPPGNIFAAGTTTVTCTARDDCGKTNACTFTVRVNPDTNPPVVVSISADCDNERVFIVYSEPMDPVSTTDPSNYSISGGVVILSVTLDASGTVATLATSGLTCAATYTLTIRHVRDRCLNLLVPNPITFTFTCPPCPPPKVAKWAQPPGYVVFPNDPQMHGGDRWSDFDWQTLMTPALNTNPPNWVIADDFRSDGRPILCVRWWGSYAPGFEPAAGSANTFEDAFVLSFLSDVRPAGAFSRPGQLLGTYVAPYAAVKKTPTQFIGWDSNRIWQYEVRLSDTCLDHADPNLARPDAFLERSNVVYWLAITAEVGHRVVPITNNFGVVIDWVQQTTTKRATNHFWGWHTSPIQKEDFSVMGRVQMQGTNWIYNTNFWMPNSQFHMERDQAFVLLTDCDTNPPSIVDINFDCATLQLVLKFSELLDPVSATDLANYGGPGVVSSVTLAGGDTVTVTLVPRPCDTLFGLCITGVKDLCGNVMSPGICIDFFCPCPEEKKVAKWAQPPGYLVFTNAGQNPQMHGGDRWSDFDWQTLMTPALNTNPPNWVIADDFRSDGRPILCVRWWGSYAPGFEPTTGSSNTFEDAFVLSFFSDVRPAGAFSRPGQLLGTYVAPYAAVKKTATPYFGWDSNRIWQYEVQLSDTCLDHADPNVSRPDAFLERSNVVYWLAITAEVGHRVVPITNNFGVVIDWVQQTTGKRATNHFWGWHTSPIQKEDLSVMGRVQMQGTNWIYNTNFWMPNSQFHMELDQAFVLLTDCDTNPPLVISVDPDCETNKIVVTFSEPMDPGPANVAANYFLFNLSGGPAATVLSAILSADGLSVCLLTTPLACGDVYTLIIATNVTDLCGNPTPQTIDGYFFSCPPCPPTKVAKWSQPPGFLVFTNNPNMHGGDRWSDVDWVTLMNSGSNVVQPNWVIAEDFRSDGRPILCVRWWGSYARGFEPSTGASGFFEDGYVLSFFSDFRPPGAFSRPRRLLGTYVAPIEAVKIQPTPYLGWDSNRIWQYEVVLADTCLDHAFQGIARPSAFLEKSNRVYWLAITAEVGHRVIPVRNTNGVVIDWVQQQTSKRATNHFWGWHTSPTQREDVSVMGHLLMPGTNWMYPPNLWMPNQPFHMEMDQAFALLTGPLVCPAPATLGISLNSSAGTVTISWPGGGGFILQSASALLNPVEDTEWTDIGPTSPVTLPVVAGQHRFYRLICP